MYWGRLLPLPSNVALSVLNEHIARPTGVALASTSWERAKRRRKRLPDHAPGRLGPVTPAIEDR